MQLGRETQLIPALQVTVHHWEKRGQGVKTGNWRQKLKQRTQGILFSWLSLRLKFRYISYIVQNHLPRHGTTCDELGQHASIINKENASHACPATGQSSWDNASTGVSSSSSSHIDNRNKHGLSPDPQLEKKNKIFSTYILCQVMGKNWFKVTYICGQ